MRIRRKLSICLAVIIFINIFSVFLCMSELSEIRSKFAPPNQIYYENRLCEYENPVIKSIDAAIKLNFMHAVYGKIICYTGNEVAVKNRLNRSIISDSDLFVSVESIAKFETSLVLQRFIE